MYFGVFTGSDIFLMCLQEVLFCHVYRWRYFGVFTAVMFCSPVMILCCVYRQQCFVVSTGGDILLCLQAVALTDSSQWLSFDAARDYCRGVGGDLVSIHSAGENSFVQNLVR